MKNVILGSIVLALTGCAHDDLPNFAEVETGIYRGGQPTAEGWEKLKAMGVTDDLKLNPESEASDDQAQYVDGVWLHYWPINLWEQTFGEPKRWALNCAVSSIHPGTYIHCSHGQDRTGLIVGLYRLQVEHWSKCSAYAEMRAHGFHPELFGLQRAWNEAK